jgi:polysaccharide chain length determinant protein (PEP-CTERM system associated)
MQTEAGFALDDLYGIARRRASLAVASAGVVVLLAILASALLPNRYEAWTTLLVEPQTISPKMVEAGLEGSDLNARLHLMTMQILSRGRLSKIIDEFGLYADQATEKTREEIISQMRDEILVEPVLPELEAGDRFQRRQEEIEINTFRLWYTSSSPKIAADVANRLANDFIDEHIKERVQVSSDTAEFVAGELTRLSQEIASVEQRIAEVKNANAGSLPEDLEANQRLLERAISDLRLAQRDLSIAESDAAFYRQQAVSGASERYGGAATPDTPRERKQRLELELGAQLARGYTEKHPDVRAIRDELAGLDDKLAAGDEEGEEVSPDQALATNEAKRAELRAESARAEITRLENQASEIEGRLEKTPRVDEQLAALQREHAHLFKSFQDYSAKQLESSVAANMERRQKGEQFRILEPAFPPDSPAYPNRVLLLVLGVMLGGLVGAGMAVVAEAVDRSLHGVRQAQVTLAMPVLAAIPKLLLASDKARLQRRRMMTAVLSVGIAAVVLIGAGAGYVIVNGPPGFVRSLISGDGAGDVGVSPATTGDRG